MTRKDYVAIAAAIQASRQSASDADVAHGEGVDATAASIADAMAADNPRFDRARFLKAAGVQS